MGTVVTIVFRASNGKTLLYILNLKDWRELLQIIIACGIRILPDENPGRGCIAFRFYKYRMTFIGMQDAMQLFLGLKTKAFTTLKDRLICPGSRRPPHSGGYFSRLQRESVH